MQAFYNGMTIIGSLVITALVIVLTYLAGRWYAGRMKGASSGRNLKVVERISLSTGCSLIVVKAADKFYLLGLSDKNVNLVCELDSFTPGMYENMESEASFGPIFDSFLKKIKGKDASNDNGGER